MYGLQQVDDTVLAPAFLGALAAAQLLTATSLLRVRSTLGVATLAGAVNTGAEFDSACSAFANLIANLIANIEPTCSDQTLTTSINRLDHRLRELLAEPGLGDSLAATRVLRNIIDLRVGQQHSGSKPYARKQSARAQLGLPLVTSSWQQDWDTVRARAVRALRQLRLALDAARLP